MSNNTNINKLFISHQKVFNKKWKFLAVMPLRLFVTFFSLYILKCESVPISKNKHTELLKPQIYSNVTFWSFLHFFSIVTDQNSIRPNNKTQILKFNNKLKTYFTKPSTDSHHYSLHRKALSKTDCSPAFFFHHFLIHSIKESFYSQTCSMRAS